MRDGTVPRCGKRKTGRPEFEGLLVISHTFVIQMSSNLRNLLNFSYSSLDVVDEGLS